MPLLRIAIVGLLIASMAWSAIRMLRNGRATLRGGIAITRRNTPVRFWASIAVQLSLVVVGLVFVWSLISKTF